MKNSTVKKSFFILGVLVIFLIWIIGEVIIKNSYIVPSLDDTFITLIKLLTTRHTYKVLGYTLLRLVVSVVLCFVLGTILAVLSYKFYQFKYFIKPLITLFKTLPIAVVIILLIVMLDKELAPYYIVGVVVLPVVYEALLIGLENINGDILNEVKMVSGLSTSVVFKVHIPLISPSILTALIQSIGLGLKVLVMAEYISQPRYSIGNEFVYYKDIALQMEYLYAWSIILIAFVLAVEILISYLSKRTNLVEWQDFFFIVSALFDIINIINYKYWKNMK